MPKYFLTLIAENEKPIELLKELHKILANFNLPPIETKNITRENNQYKFNLNRQLSYSEYELLNEIVKKHNDGFVLEGDILPPEEIFNSENAKWKQFCEDWAKLQHQSWYKQMTEKGWGYGTTRSAKNKTHPMMQPWENLPEEWRKVDYSIPETFLQLIQEYGFNVKRTNK